MPILIGRCGAQDIEYAGYLQAVTEQRQDTRALKPYLLGYEN